MNQSPHSTQSITTQRLTPQQFAAKWSASTLSERSGAQEHFIDLCRMLGEPTPAEADPHGENYCFERNTKKTSGGKGWADVWRKGCFAWEYKGKHKDLVAAFSQLQRYAIALENPPLLVVSDMEVIEIHTNFTNTVHHQHVIPLSEIGSEKSFRLLKYLFSDPERLRPDKTKTAITEEAASRFAELAQVLRDRGGQAQQVAHFLNRILFCLFAQDAQLLPDDIVAKIFEPGLDDPGHANKMLGTLFDTMQSGGHFGTHVIEWFNGNLFDSGGAVPLEKEDIREILSVARLDWSAIEPSVFGTLFERGLDPDKRSQIGAHYTDPESIKRVIRPVIVDPLAGEWDDTKRRIVRLIKSRDSARRGSTSNRKAQQLFNAFLDRLARFVVLDPACGSGNFLYIALQELKNIEHRASLEAEQLGLALPLQGMHVGVQCLRGIEVNSFAAELARVTVWIGEIQWMLRHGMRPARNPILKPLETIECRDAVVHGNGAKAKWPSVDVIVGNPPFLGNKKMNGELGKDYSTKLRRAYKDRVPGAADLVCYWFEKARAHIASKRAKYAGLVGTNSIRGGANRKVLDRIGETGIIFDAWSDEDWINEGAAVRVSLVAFGSQAPLGKIRLNGLSVKGIHTDLTAAGDLDASDVDLTKAKQLPENADCAFMGITKVGSFDVSGDVARIWLTDPNAHGLPNADVLKPSWNGTDVTKRIRDKWIVDFGTSMSVSEAARYAAPFKHVREHVLPLRAKNNREVYRKNWWRHGESRPGLRAKLAKLRRAIVTPEVSKHRLFVWMPTSILPDKNLHVITRDDDVAFGVLHSRFHAVWAARLGSSLEDRPRYTPSTTFETFAFPPGLTLDRSSASYDNSYTEAVAAEATNLNELRERWLNPPEWVDEDKEFDERYPMRIVAKEGNEDALRKRTLTNLYNEMPNWLEQAHEALDKAVARAYGWDDYSPVMSDEEIVSRLFRLNTERATDLFEKRDKKNVRRRAVASSKNAAARSRTSRRPDDKALQRRLAVVCTLVNRLADDRNFGRTKMAKLLYLADASLELDLETTYHREAAGPLDTRALYSRQIGVEALAKREKYVTAEQKHKMVRYKRGENISAALEIARQVLGKQRRSLNRLIDLFRPLDTEQCEIIATLYACWNDKLLDNEGTSDAEILREFFSWHDSKQRFTKGRVLDALKWMKANHIVPSGKGEHTQAARQ